jgi:hypothetical protein
MSSMRAQHAGAGHGHSTNGSFNNVRVSPEDIMVTVKHYDRATYRRGTRLRSVCPQMLGGTRSSRDLGHLLVMMLALAVSTQHLPCEDLFRKQVYLHVK